MIKYIVEEYEHCTVTLDMEGKYHSFNDRPAYVGKSGHKEWHKNEYLHRETGPAIIYPDGTESFYLEGEKLSKEEHAKRTKKN